MKTSYFTTRLILSELSLIDEKFIVELVNTPEWIKFIGDRNIRTQADARLFIKKVIDNSTIKYWTVKLKESNVPIGIITFIKRDNLEHYDIGFAFLSKFTNKGYAYEATAVVLNDVINDITHTHILAITVKENVSSIRLLEKLGLRFEKKIKSENNLLSVYSVPINKLLLNKIV